MTFDPSRWTRFQTTDTAIWLCPDRPAWFVPTAKGDQLLQQLAAGTTDQSIETLIFLQRLPDPSVNRYQGRQALLSGMPVLRELWLHITDRCNLSCTHCLFSSGPDCVRELSLQQMKQHIDDASAQGCRLFALTGGEPLVHPDFVGLIDHILAIPDSRIAILTNGLLVADKLNRQWAQDRLHRSVICSQSSRSSGNPPNSA